MSPLPDDETARLEWLRSWGAEQERLTEQRRLADERLISRRLARVAQHTRRALYMVENRAEQLADRLLDRRLHTSGTAVEPEHAHRERAHYVPSAWHVLPEALRYIGVGQSDTFVDFGCGKGRVVHQAARRPFHRVIGVEISPALAEVARAALSIRRHQHRCRNVEIVVCDAAQFRVPDDLTIGYFCQPFSGNTFDTVLGNIIGSVERHPRRVRLIYVQPVLATQILATGRFRLVTELRGEFRDAYAWRTAIFETR